MQQLKGHSGWGKTWSKITWEPQDGNNGLIKFELPNGYYEKYTCDDNGNIGFKKAVKRNKECEIS